ncbi:MAG: hypothetical protein HOC70_04250 [Gammaproteobacteria bacterium]|jgi:ferric-dicitrate binding protein FerR (iron transport regulator)|nr:hypothetical protein [Gammaproteobacteria bacterium]MBT4492432.1 hypothetical protein [Gammaproteobacteria bacterium]MBT7372252.1 hypothetical protein [Gammaproteobacteria bacterium]
MTDRNIDDNRVEQLLQGAGRRTPIPEEVRDRLETSFLSELNKSQQRNSRTRVVTAGSLAASVLVAVVLVFNSGSEQTRDLVASVTKDRGEVNWTYDNDLGPLTAGNTIQLGDVITTGTGSVSFAPVASSLDIRLAARSEISFVEPTTISLNQGTIYIDSGYIGSKKGGEQSPLKILVNGVSVEHIGTQYMVSRNEHQIEVAVREGEVRIDHEGASVRSFGGLGHGELTQFSDGRLVTTKPIATHDSRWSWAAELSPAIETNEMPVLDFMNWVSEQTGYSIVYRVEIDPGDRISGSVLTDDAMSALDEVMTISEYISEIDNARGAIIVSPAS